MCWAKVSPFFIEKFAFALTLCAPAPLCLSLVSHAMSIPKQLSSSDRREVTRTLGASTSPKLVSNPYPLGGYDGFEVGLTLEIIDVQDLARLGCAPDTPDCPNEDKPRDPELRYARFTVGKGLFYDVDMFLHFVPPASQTRFTDFGASIRWCFYQAKFVPIHFSALLHLNQTNIQDDFVNQNVGGQLIAGINVDRFALYFGVGRMRSKATFIATNGSHGTVSPSDPEVSDSQTVSTKLVENHTFVGIHYDFTSVFVAGQIDRYQDPVYALKLGVRF